MMTNLKNHLVEFSQGWESYVNECMRLVDDSLRFYVTKDHRVYEVLIKTVVSEIQSLVDERIYKVKGSVGQSSLTGIPWLSVMDKHVTESTQEGFYISYLFSKNAKKLHLSIALGATQFEDLYGANNKTTDKIIQAKNQFVQNFKRHAPEESFETMDLLDEKDTNFTREFSTTMTRIADYYEGGSFFTKSYDLVNPNFEEDAKIADKFLTHCEPPHHDQWTDSTDAFKALYPKNQGAKKRFNENMDSIKDAISELLREDFEVTSDIPREMQKLLTFPGEGSAGETGDKETRNFRIRLIQQEIEFSERNSTYKIPVEMTAPQSLEKTVSVKVGILGDSIKSSDKLELPFTIGSLAGKSASLEKNNIIKVDHTKFSSRKTSRKINFSFIVNVGSVGVDPFNIGLSLENPQVLEVH